MRKHGPNKLLSVGWDLCHPFLTAGHYGVVRIGTNKETGMKVAIKSVPKRRAVYVEMLRLEIDVLRVGCDLAAQFECRCDLPVELPAAESITR